MFEKAPAKVNLHLRVFGKRPDGFHAMQTIMLKVGFYDEVHMHVEEGKGIHVDVEGYPQLSNTDNLIYRACSAYLHQANLQKKITFELKKNIFMAAGLGGGSSDAALVLKMLNRYFEALPFETLLKIGAQLGSDVPFFLYDTPLGYAYERGEKIIPLKPLVSKSIVLVNPGFGLSTADIYKKLGAAPCNSSVEFKCPPLEKEFTWEELAAAYPFENDLQGVVEREFPVLSQILATLKTGGARFSMMSGSGSTLFGVFDTEMAAEKAAEVIKNEGFRAVFMSSL